MPHAVTVVAPGLQALILCGPGSSFPTFTANPDENPKALLPIANRPMVWYPLSFCYRVGITDITLICPPTATEALKTSLKTNPFLTSLPLPSPTLLAPKDLTHNTGTADILRLPEVRASVTKDFFVLPCDLVCELGGDKLVQAWMVKASASSLAANDGVLGSGGEVEADSADAADGSKSSLRSSGGLGVWYDTTANPIKGEETDFIMTTSVPALSVAPPKGSVLPNLANLVYSMPKDSLNDLTEEKKGLPLRHGLLRKHPRIRMTSNHRDAHIYIFPRWVMDFVAENDHLESIGEDVVGWWAKAGWQAGLDTKLGLDRILGYSSAPGDQQHKKKKGGSSGNNKVSSSESDTSSDGTPHSPTAATIQTQTPTQPTAAASSAKDATSTASTTTTTTPIAAAQPKSAFATAASANPTTPTASIPPILAYIHPSTPSSPLIRRVDTAAALLEVSLQLAKLPSLEEIAATTTTSVSSSPFAHARKVAYPEGVAPRTTITRQDCLVADNVIVEEKTSIKESVVGANCRVMEGAKLQHCLLMDGAVVGKGCRLVRCILGRRSQVGEGCVLVDCEVQENLLVEARTEEKNTKIMSSSGLEATEEEMQEVLQGLSSDDEQGMAGE